MVPAGFGLALFSLPGKELLFLVLLPGLIIPYQALLTPLDLQLTALGLANTHLGLAIIHTLLQLPFSIYLMCLSFEALPRDLQDAARIDGCTSLLVLVRVLLPSVAPALVMVALFAFITFRNELLTALIVMSQGTEFTVPVMLVGVRQGRFGAVDWGALQAGVVVSIISCLPAYLLLQRYYVSGLLAGAVKMTGGAGQRRRTHPTIRDMARLAQVSIGTVSKALHGNGQLREETRAKVIAAATQLGFRPNDLAHSLHRGQSFTVGVISNDSFGRFTTPIVEGLEERLVDHRISVFICNATGNPEREARHVAALLGKRVDGIVVTARRANRRARLRLPASDVPVIYVFSQTDDQDSLCLLPNDRGSAALATNHLIGLCRQRIAHVTGPERFEAVRLRRDGYIAALGAAGLAATAAHYLAGEWSEAWGTGGRSAVVRCARRTPGGHLLWQRPDRPWCRGCAPRKRRRGVARCCARWLRQLRNRRRRNPPGADQRRHEPQPTRV